MSSCKFTKSADQEPKTAGGAETATKKRKHSRSNRTTKSVSQCANLLVSLVIASGAPRGSVKSSVNKRTFRHKNEKICTQTGDGMGTRNESSKCWRGNLRKLKLDLS